MSLIAKSEPQSPYSDLVTGFQQSLAYHIRTIPDLNNLPKPQDRVIDTQFISTITDGHICSADERELLALLINLDEVAIPLFSKWKYEHSEKTCTKLCKNIKKSD